MLTAHKSATSVEHFARIVDSRKWRDVAIQMLTACFDASGKTPSTTTKARSLAKRKTKPASDDKVMAVAGFASQAGIWSEFDLSWAAVLEKYHVPLFHAGDFAHSRKAFEVGWKGEWNKRRDFQAELMEVIRGCGLRKFGNVLWTPDRDKARALLGVQGDSTASPYVLCCRASVEDFLGYAKGEGQRESVKYIFEKGDEESRLRQHFLKHGFHDPHFAWKQPVEKKGITEPPFLGLQAAGWLVWEYYMNFNRAMTGLFDHDVEGRWALRTFDDHRLVRGEIKILYVSSPLQNFIGQSDASWPNFCDHITDSVVRLEAAKRNGIEK